MFRNSQTKLFSKIGKHNHVRKTLASLNNLIFEYIDDSFAELVCTGGIFIWEQLILLLYLNLFMIETDKFSSLC